MKIKVNKVEGKTSKKGTKQGRIYEILLPCRTNGFFEAISDTGKEFSIWNVNGDWSKIGISKGPKGRMTYTEDFEIIN